MRVVKLAPNRRKNSEVRLLISLPKSHGKTSRHRFFQGLLAWGLWGTQVLGSPLELKTLDYNDPILQALRQSVKTNLRASKSVYASSEIQALQFYHYKVKSEDGFFEIMSKTGMDLDTLSSVNELASPHDIYPGQILEIPNMRGIFFHEEMPNQPSSKQKLAELYQIPASILQFDPSRKKFFLPGIRLSRKEKSFVDGTGFMRPIRLGFLSSGFGKRLDPFSKKETFHGGIDLAAPEGTPVLASQDGVVEFRGNLGNYGNLIIIKHGLGYETRYGHLSRYSVENGDRVKKGQKLGEVGKTWKATGPHLHFEVIRNSKKQKPVFRNH